MVSAKKKRESNNLVASAFPVNALLICIYLFNFQQLVDASCLSLNGQIGECVKFGECYSAVILSRKGVSSGFCSLEEGTVCCTDYSNTAQRENKPFSQETQASYSQKRSSGFGASSAITRDIFEDNPNFRRKINSVAKSMGNSNNSYNYSKKKTNSDIFEEPYKFETLGTYYTSVETTNKPGRRPGRPVSLNEEGNFLPPDLAKKKTWKEEKTTENGFYYELVTKKANRGPNPKGSNKHSGSNYESNNARKWAEVNTESFEQGGKRTTNNWYNSQNEYENSYSNQRETPKRNNLGQGTIISTKLPDYFGSTPESNYAGGEVTYSNAKPTRRTQSPSLPTFITNRPDFQESSPQGSHRPSYPHDSLFGSNRPNYPENLNFEDNRPNSRPDFQKKTISEQKCEEYSKQVTENITGLPLTTNPDPVIIPVRKCITPQQLIVGGENTTLGEFPHMAAIGFRDRNKKQISWNCGGTLISEEFVMTAAHCTSTSSGRPVKVRLGEYNLMKNDDGAYPVDYAITEIITHPDYKPPSKYNDIALLKLSRKVTFFRHIRPACLYSETTFSASKAIATGWGRMYYDGGTSEILQKVVLSIIDNYTCNRLYKVNVKTEVLSRGIINSQICAGELTGGKDTCQGDSGGPLSITNTKCIHHIIGITSFGKSCALPNSTGVYTRVSAYVPWIESVVWPINYN